MQGAYGAFEAVGRRPRNREQQMRMAVYEARHDHAPVGGDFDGAARQGQVLYPPRRPHFNQHAVANQQGAVLDDVKLVEFRPAPRCLGAAQCQQLTGSADEDCSRTLYTVTLP